MTAGHFSILKSLLASIFAIGVVGVGTESTELSWSSSSPVLVLAPEVDLSISLMSLLDFFSRSFQYASVSRKDMSPRMDKLKSLSSMAEPSEKAESVRTARRRGSSSGSGDSLGDSDGDFNCHRITPMHHAQLVT